jgi:hypothetical protein
VVPAVPRYTARPRPDLADRSDLVCTVCLREVAFGVRSARLDEDAEFYLEQHRPFCMAVG